MIDKVLLVLITSSSLGVGINQEVINAFLFAVINKEIGKVEIALLAVYLIIGYTCLRGIKLIIRVISIKEDSFIDKVKNKNKK